MGIFSSFFNSNKSETKYRRAGIKDFKRTRARTDPFFQQQLDRGGQASNVLADVYGLNGTGAQQSVYDNYLTSPGFDARFDQGTKAIDQSAAARGGLQSGDTLKALYGYGQGLYADDFNQYLAGLGGIQQGGYAGAQGLTANSGTLANLYTGLGQSKDQGYQGGLANVSGALGMGASFLSGGGGFGGGSFGAPATLNQIYGNGRLF